MFTSLETVTNTTLLNKVMSNVFPEFNNKPEHRNTYTEDGKLVRWIDNPLGAPIKKTLRDCTEKEIAIWEGYKALVAGLHMEEEEN